MAMAAVSPRGIFVSPETSLPTGRFSDVNRVMLMCTFTNTIKKRLCILAGRVHVSVKARKLLTANSARAFGLLCVATFSKSRRLPHCSCKAGRALAPHRSVQIDQDGRHVGEVSSYSELRRIAVRETLAMWRHWEAAVSRIGPRLPETIKSIDEAWRTGAGLLRVACFEAHRSWFPHVPVTVAFAQPSRQAPSHRSQWLERICVLAPALAESVL